MNDPFSDLSSAFAESDAKPDRIPPIRILDMFVLMTGVALAFFFTQQMQRLYAEGNRAVGSTKTWALIIQGFYSIPFGVSIASLYWFVNQKRIVGKFFCEPGHWLLAQSTLYLVILNGVQLVALWAGASTSIFFKVYCVCSVICSLATVIFLMVGSSKVEGSWQWLFILQIFGAGGSAVVFITIAMEINVLIPISEVAGAIFYAACLLLLAVAVVSDLRHSRSRDWLHWIAVGMEVINILVTPILFYLLQYFSVDL